MGELVTLRKKIRHVCRRKEDKTILFYQIQRQFGEIWNRFKLKSVAISLIQVCWCGGLNTEEIPSITIVSQGLTSQYFLLLSTLLTQHVLWQQIRDKETWQNSLLLLLLQSQETMDCKYRILLSFLHLWLQSAVAYSLIWIAKLQLLPKYLFAFLRILGNC